MQFNSIRHDPMQCECYYVVLMGTQHSEFEIVQQIMGTHPAHPASRISIDRRDDGLTSDGHAGWISTTHDWNFRNSAGNSFSVRRRWIAHSISRFSLTTSTVATLSNVFYLKEANKKEARNEHNEDLSFRLFLGIFYIRIHCRGGSRKRTLIDWRPNMIFLLLTNFIFRR
jgi:hypothetical protein